METLTDAFFTVVKMDGCGLLAALVVMIALLVLRRTRASKTALLLLWLVAGLRLICPWAPASPLSLFNLGAAQQMAENGMWGLGRLEDTYVGYVQAGVRSPDGDHPEYDRAVAAGAEPVFVDDIHMSVAYYSQDASGRITPALTFRERYGGTAALIWLAGMAVFLGCGAVSWLLLKRRLRFAVKDEATPVFWVGDEPAGVWLSDRIPSPCVTGFASPQIYLTFGMSEQEKGYVLAHEKQHIRNHDQLWKLTGWLILCIHWFDPALWLVYRAFLGAVEAACDQRVLRELGEDRKADYGQALLSLSTRKRFRPGFSPLAFGEADTKERVKTVLRYRKPLAWITAAAVALGALAGTAVLTRAESEAAAPEALAAEGLVQTGDPISYTFSPRHGWDFDTIKRSGPFPFQFDGIGGCDRVEVSCENSQVFSFEDQKCIGAAIYTTRFTASLPCIVYWCPIPGGDIRGRFGGTVKNDTVRFTLYSGEEPVLRGAFLIRAGKLDRYGGGTFAATTWLSDAENFHLHTNPADPQYSGAVLYGAPAGALPLDDSALPDTAAQWIMPAGTDPGFPIRWECVGRVSRMEVECGHGSLSLDTGGTIENQGRSAVLTGGSGELYWSPVNNGVQTELDALTFTIGGYSGTVLIRKLGEADGKSVYMIAAGKWLVRGRCFRFTADAGRAGATLRGGFGI